MFIFAVNVVGPDFIATLADTPKEDLRTVIALLAFLLHHDSHVIGPGSFPEGLPLPDSALD